MYFCTKLRKKVDTDIIGAIVAVIITVILGLVENAAKKARRAKRIASATAHKETPRESVMNRVAESARHAAPDAAASRITVPGMSRPDGQPYQFRAEAEGTRVTADEAAAFAPRSEIAAHPAMSRDELRRAIVLGEILSRKF